MADKNNDTPTANAIPIAHSHADGIPMDSIPLDAILEDDSGAEVIDTRLAMEIALAKIAKSRTKRLLRLERLVSQLEERLFPDNMLDGDISDTRLEILYTEMVKLVHDLGNEVGASSKSIDFGSIRTMLIEKSVRSAVSTVGAEGADEARELLGKLLTSISSKD